MQAQSAALLSIAAGESIIEENLFESRFKYVTRLNKMGANINCIGNRAYIIGVRSLKGGEVDATDLRGGAALISAALSAEGTSIITGINHVDRGYEEIEKSFYDLGADIRRVK